MDKTRGETMKPRESTGAAFERNLRRIRTEGLDAATQAAIDLLRDPEAPSQAKAATINAVFRSAGMFEGSASKDDVAPEEMSPEQLQRAIEKIKRDSMDAME